RREHENVEPHRDVRERSHEPAPVASCVEAPPLALAPSLGPPGFEESPAGGASVAPFVAFAIASSSSHTRNSRESSASRRESASRSFTWRRSARTSSIASSNVFFRRACLFSARKTYQRSPIWIGRSPS